MKEQIKDLINQALDQAKKDTRLPDFVLGEEIQIEHPQLTEHGDYATNIALKLAKIVKLKPVAVAELVVEEILKLKEVKKNFSSVRVNRPGFINFIFSKDYLVDQANQVKKLKDKFGGGSLGAGQTVVIDYSSPNIAKPMHVGHLRSTVIGDSLYRLAKFLDYKTISDNHIGDWGTQFGLLLYAYKNFGDKKKVEKDPINELNKLYIDASQQAKDDKKIKAAGKAEFKKLEDGDPENKELWLWFTEVSMKKFETAYQLLGINKFDYVLGESFYEDKMSREFDELLEKGIAKKDPDHSIYVDLEPYKLGRCILVKSDGATTYHLRDIATYRYRLEEFKFDQNLYVVDFRQSHHFLQLFKVLELMGLPEVDQSFHVSFGMLKLPSGSTMSTREGNLVELELLIKEGVEKAQKVISEKNPNLKNKDEVARQIAVGAIKYADLSHNRETDIIFDWDKYLQFEGNTGPYLQYTHARIKSILSKTDFKFSKINPDHLTGKEEIALLRKLYIFPEIVQQAFEDYLPSLIANYLFQLASDFNLFYNNLPVLKADDKIKKARLNLAAAVAQILKNGLDLLGIEAPEEM
ncbi:MAG TPA: arginine--tRNA ligase [Patescibacteria group bacterium]